MTAQDFLIQLWCDPLHQIGPGWLAPGDRPWTDRLRGAATAHRLAHRLLCDRLGLPVEPVPTLDGPDKTLHTSVLLALPATGAGLMDAARFTAMAAFAGQDSFSAVWARHAKTLLVAASAEHWRSAIAAGRARRLPVTPGSLMTARTGEDFTVHGMALLAAACEAALQGLWPRLRLRCPRHLAEAAAFSETVPVPRAEFQTARLDSDAAACRQIMRLCLTAAAAPHSSTSPPLLDASFHA